MYIDLPLMLSSSCSSFSIVKTYNSFHDWHWQAEYWNKYLQLCVAHQSNSVVSERLNTVKLHTLFLQVHEVQEIVVSSQQSNFILFVKDKVLFEDMI